MTVEIEPVELDMDARRVVSALQLRLAEHYRSSLLAGRRADGSGSLPTNSRGQPMGRGSGTIATNWELGPVEGGKMQAQASTGPYMEGGYRYVVLRLEDEDASLVSIEGAAAQLIDDVLEHQADLLMGSG